MCLQAAVRSLHEIDLPHNIDSVASQTAVADIRQPQCEQRTASRKHCSSSLERLKLEKTKNFLPTY
jgi:hypothetical protein